MLRTLEEIANATPQDYSSHAPHNPHTLAVQMHYKAQQLFPKTGDGDANYRLMFVGPGAGLVVKELIDMDQQARGLETSKRGISTAPQEVWSYILWAKPWELGMGDKTMEVCLTNRYLKQLLTPDEWSRTVKELQRISKYTALI